MRSSSASVTAKPSSSRRKKRSAVQPATARACSYSAKVGAVTSARFGFSASAIRKIRSAAPLPHKMLCGGTPNVPDSFFRSARHNGSG